MGLAEREEGHSQERRAFGEETCGQQCESFGRSKGD